jgi:hypothetical protein
VEDHNVIDEAIREEAEVRMLYSVPQTRKASHCCNSPGG